MLFVTGIANSFKELLVPAGRRNPPVAGAACLRGTVAPRYPNYRFMLVAFIIGGAASPVMGQNQYSVYSVRDLGTLGGSSR